MTLTKSFPSVVSIAFAIALAVLGTSCGDDDVPAGDTPDASEAVADADPTLPDADLTAPDADPTLPDAMPGMPDGTPMGGPDAAVGVACGGTTCGQTDVCCVTNAQGGGTTETCVAAGTCQGAAVACDGPEDCSGNACCVTAGGGVTAACAAGTTCPGQSLTLCHADGDCPKVQNTAGKCCPPTQNGTQSYCSLFPPQCL